jgi:hypothetical protein
LIVHIIGHNLVHKPFHHLLKVVKPLCQWRFRLLSRLWATAVVKLLAATGCLPLLAADAYCVIRAVKLALDFPLPACYLSEFLTLI